MAYDVVKKSNGDTTVYNEPGQGSTFHVYLPMMEKTAPYGDGHTLLLKPDML